LIRGHALLVWRLSLCWSGGSTAPTPGPALRAAGARLVAESLHGATRVLLAAAISQGGPDQLDLPPLPSRRRGVVLMHGFVCNRGFWNPWLRAAGQVMPFVAVNLEPVFGSIDAYAADHRAGRAACGGLTGRRRCWWPQHGRLAARAWLRSTGGTDRVAHVITIGTPHRGTWLGRFSHVVNGRQMRLGGDWVTDLGQRVAPDTHAGFTCWYSNCDNIVFPASTATLPGADNRLLYGAAHVELAFRTEVMGASLAKIASL
jgi:hypothetical protein